jgi:histidinol-phosphate phosphatase family protein
VRLGVVTNQSGLARGHITTDDVAAVNARVDEILGPIGIFRICPHSEIDACTCRKPAPALITAAAEALGANPKHCVVIGDIGSDVRAARAAGARAVLVPTEATLPEEVADAALVAADLRSAVDLALGERR